MDQHNDPTVPEGNPTDPSAMAVEAARRAALADAEATQAVQAAEAAVARAVAARSALEQAAAAQTAVNQAAAIQAAAVQAAAIQAAALAASGTSQASQTPGAPADVALSAPASAPAPTTAPDAMTQQKIFYNASPYAQVGAGAPPLPPTQGKPSAFRKRTVGLVIGGAAALVLALGGGGYALGASIVASNTAASTTITETPQSTTDPDEYQETMPFGGSGTEGTLPSDGSDSSSTDTSTDATAATDEQTEGVVTIVSTLYYSEATQAAGTGIILTSDGEILTNNHVIDGATSIAVTVESTGVTYEATVVGTDSTNDIAVLQLVDASGLDVSTTDDSTLTVGDEATSIGNAEGTGDLVAAAGTITALEESITVGNEYTGAEESLSGLIEVDADVVSGDSGGPLVDSDGDVIGIVTAASSGTTNITGYAIPIETALDIVDQIESGVETDTVEIGLPAFLGVQLATTQESAGVVVGGVIADTPAATAGFAAGDIITAVDGTAVTTAEALSTLISSYEAGDSVTISYTDAAGAAQQATVTLIEGPAN